MQIFPLTYAAANKICKKSKFLNKNTIKDISGICLERLIIQTTQIIHATFLGTHKLYKIHKIMISVTSNLLIKRISEKGTQNTRNKT